MQTANANGEVDINVNDDMEIIGDDEHHHTKGDRDGEEKDVLSLSDGANNEFEVIGDDETKGSTNK